MDELKLVLVARVLDEFYATVRRDPLLGPIFNAKVGNWDEHLTTLCRFWSSVTLLTGAYKGRPMVVHAALPDLSATHFARWLALFKETAEEIVPP